MNKPQDYKCIAIWGNLLGSYRYYIEAEQQRAAFDQAPLTAIYKNGTEWVCAEDIESAEARKQVISRLAKAAAKG